MTTYSHIGLKNAGAQTDAPGSGSPSIAATRTYDAFGATTASTGTWQGPFGYAGQFGYQASQSADPLGGVHLLGHRYYDPTLGRFHTRDPKYYDGSYVYCDSAPLDFYDDGGEDKVIVHSNPGGFGMGGHAYVGLEDERGNRSWYSFCPNPPEHGGGSSGKGRGSSKGPGRVSLLPPPSKARSRNVEFNITAKQRLKVKVLVFKEMQDRLNGGGRRYDLKRYNCVSWIVQMLDPLVNDPDRPISPYSNPISGPPTPKSLLDWASLW